mgnify:CR=1 FL=1
MDDIISKLKTPEECAIYEKNVTERGQPDLAVAARKREIELRALAHGATSDGERECLEAVYAYERVLSERNHKKTRAARTWQMIKRHGILPAVERAVNRPTETAGYRALIEMGLEDYAFEAVILRHPTLFSPEAVQRSQARINERTDVEKLWHQTFDQCGAFIRDTTLPSGFLEKYQVGLLLKDPTFCDASHKIGGFVAPHRFLIISSNAQCLDKIAPQPWGLCVWPSGSFFKVIDKIVSQSRAQITLLEIPEGLLRFFAQQELAELEQSFALKARQTFEECMNADPVPELNTDEWRQRLVYPIGIDDQGNLFPHGNKADQSASDGVNFRIEVVGISPSEADDVVTVLNEVRHGDIVCYDRVGPKELVMRVLTPAEADTYSGKKYRIELNSEPGVIRLIEVTE